MARKVESPLGKLGSGHSGEELRQRSARSGAVTLIAQWTRFLLHTVSTMVLARLLTPADFGMIGMVTVLTGFLNVLKDAGLSAATVQRDVITHQQVSALFWINLGLGVILACLSAMLAPILVIFYGEPRLLGVTFAFAVTFVASALMVQHHALMRREMRFKALAVIEISSMVVGVTAGISMAAHGFGYWSLVGMPIASIVTNLVCLWAVQSWRPGKFQSGSGIRSMLRFGGFLTCSNMLNYVFRNVDNVLIGWYWGAGALGLYVKAYGLLLLPINQVNSPINAVAISTLSRMQKDEARMRRYFVGGYSVVASIILPIVVATIVFAEEVIRIMLGEQWIRAVDLFRYLAPAALVGALSNPLGWILWATGRSDRLFRLSVFWTSMIVLGFVAGLRFGPEGVAIGYSVMSIVAAWPNCAFMIKGTPVRISDIGQAIVHPLLAVTLAGLCALGFKLAMPSGTSMILTAVAGGGLMLGLYALLLLGVMRKWAFYCELIRQVVGRRDAGGMAGGSVS